MKKKTKTKRDLEKTLLLRSETLRHLDLKAVNGRGEVTRNEPAICPDDSCGCTGTYEALG